MQKNIRTTILLFLYLFLLSYFILFKASWSYFRECMQRILSGNIQPFRVNWIPFQNLYVALQNWKNPWLMMNLLVNVWLFCPWGIFIGSTLAGMHKGGCVPWIGWLFALVAGVGLSLCYELIQLKTGIGTFDVDDIILNGTGAMLGYAGYSIFQQGKTDVKPAVGSIWSYGLIQTTGNLVSLTVWTVLYFLFSVAHPYCFWIGMACGACVSCVIQRKRWQNSVQYLQPESGEIHPSLLCFVSKLVQIWLLHSLVQRWVPNGLPGLGMACGLCVLVFGIWYQMGQKYKPFCEKNKNNWKV